MIQGFLHWKPVRGLGFRVLGLGFRLAGVGRVRAYRDQSQSIGFSAWNLQILKMSS